MDTYKSYIPLNIFLFIHKYSQVFAKTITDIFSGDKKQLYGLIVSWIVSQDILASMAEGSGVCVVYLIASVTQLVYLDKMLMIVLLMVSSNAYSVGDGGCNDNEGKDGYTYPVINCHYVEV